jgi:site-specific DNA-methyltransferase (adenine-specific)
MAPTWRLLAGDCRQVLPALPADCMASIVTDPPYEIALRDLAWDRSGVAFDPETWRQAWRVLRPGGYLAAFAAPRRAHRVTCAIEDAGFLIEGDLLLLRSLAWVYARSWPKTRQALKPTHETILLAQKPLDGSLADNLARWGTGVLQIEASRLPAVSRPAMQRTARQAHSASLESAGSGSRETGARTSLGRWPSDTLLLHQPACVEDGACAPDCVVADLDCQGGPVRAGRGVQGASDFFPSFRFSGKASPSEKQQGCLAIPNDLPAVKPVALVRWLVRLLTPPGGHVLDMFTGSASVGVAALAAGHPFTGIEQDPHAFLIAAARLQDAQQRFA